MRKKKTGYLMLALLLSAVLFSVGCQAEPAAAEDPDEGAAGGVCEGGSVTTQQAEQMIADGAVVLDVRTPEDYEAGHIPGALLLSRSSESFLRMLQELPRDLRYLAYCSCPDDGTSRATIVDMVALDFGSACNMEGGYPDWVAEGLPYETGPLTAECNGGTLSPLLSWNLMYLGATVIDVRTESQYAGGHVPGALLISRSADDYEDQLDALSRDDTYVVICASGAASHATVEDMMNMGFESACSVEGGYGAWQQVGLPLEMDAP